MQVQYNDFNNIKYKLHKENLSNLVFKLFESHDSDNIPLNVVMDSANKFLGRYSNDYPYLEKAIMNLDIAELTGQYTVKLTIKGFDRLMKLRNHKNDIISAINNGSFDLW